jgi:hypothetical protein
MRFFLLGIAGIIAAALPVVAADHGPFPPSSVEVYFSPKGGTTGACVAAIAAAKTTISVQAYSLTSAPIAVALVAAKKRGVIFEIITPEWMALHFPKNPISTARPFSDDLDWITARHPGGV